MTPRESEPILERVTVAKPAPAVFRALTDSDEVAAWFGEDAYIELCEDGRYEVLGRQGWKKGRISSLEEDKRLVITWPVEIGEDHEETTTIDFRVEARGDSTMVIVHHSGLRDGGEWDPVYRELKEGWPQTLAAFGKFMEGALQGKQRHLLP